MNMRRLQKVLPALSCVLVIACCASAESLHGQKSEKTAEDSTAHPFPEPLEEDLPPGQIGLMPDMEFTERPVGGLDFDALLQDRAVKESFASCGIDDPSDIPDYMLGFHVQRALLYALRSATIEKPPSPAVVKALRRIAELIVWQVMRFECVQAEHGLPDTLEPLEREDLDEIDRRFIPQLLGLDLPSCEEEEK